MKINLVATDSLKKEYMEYAQEELLGNVFGKGKRNRLVWAFSNCARK